MLCRPKWNTISLTALIAVTVIVALILWNEYWQTEDIPKEAEPLDTSDYDDTIFEERIQSIEYEHLRRRIYSNIQELYNFVESELKKMQINNPELGEHANEVIQMTAEHKRSLINDMDHWRKIDGYEEWRRTQAKSLGDLMQRRIEYIQNPEDCSKAKKLYCTLNMDCGFGCQLHHAAYCLITAYATERMLYLDTSKWNYKIKDWEAVFEPLSDTCKSPIPVGRRYMYHINDYEKIVNLPLLSVLSIRPPFLPMAIPEDLAPTLLQLHGDPIVWFVGQFVKYLLRFNPTTQQFIDDGMKVFNFTDPMVGIHIRRSDKIGTEAAFHHIDEYMKHVDEYFNQVELEQKIEKRRLYVASDDPSAVNEIFDKYPHYDVYDDPVASKMASSLGTRYSEESLNGLIFDIHVLSQSDYIVCTFSSQICRIVYELMQTKFPDASQRFKSLDDIYYFGGQQPHNRIAKLPHYPENTDEIAMKVDDVICILGNHWDGFSMGQNTRTNKTGIFPSFKVDDEILIAKFPIYSNIQNFSSVTMAPVLVKDNE